jgi:hypothetical protein
MGLISVWRRLTGKRRKAEISEDLITDDNLFHGPAGDFHAGVAAPAADIDHVCYFYRQGWTEFYFYQYPRHIDGRLCLYVAGVARTRQGPVVNWFYSGRERRKARENLLWVLRHKSFPIDHDRNPDHLPTVVFDRRLG